MLLNCNDLFCNDINQNILMYTIRFIKNSQRLSEHLLVKFIPLKIFSGLFTLFPYTAQKMKFSIKDFFSKVSCGFSHIYWRNPSWKTSFFLYNVKQFDLCHSFRQLDLHIYLFLILFICFFLKLLMFPLLNPIYIRQSIVACIFMFSFLLFA